MVLKTGAKSPVSYFKKKHICNYYSKSGGIAVDLHLHSIDIFNWLTGGKITEYSGIMPKSVLKEKPDF